MLPLECYKLVESAGHEACIQTVFNTFFDRNDTKKNVVYIHGIASSGKTTFIELIESIFHCQYIEWQYDHVCSQPQSRPQGFKTQIVLCPELAVWACFSTRNVNKTLQFFEGKGCFVKPNLFEKYVFSFANCNWLIASNELP